MIPPQSFELNDFGRIGFLLVLEALLSADNALILAIIVRHLPSKALQKKALFYGLLGAFVLRFLAILLAGMILNFWWLQAIGALYLIYLPARHFLKKVQQEEQAAIKGAGFWMTVVYADLADLAFALDSVLVAVAVVDKQNKLWVVWVGAFLGIVLLRFAANFCLALLERYPMLDHVAYVLVGWAGLKLLLVSGHTFELWYARRNPGASLPVNIPELHPAVFWGGMALIVIFGIGSAWLHNRKLKRTDGTSPVGDSPSEEQETPDEASED